MDWKQSPRIGRKNGNGMSTKPDSRADVHEILSSISLDAVVRGFTDYVHTSKIIFSEHRHFARRYMVDRSGFSFRFALKIYLYGVAVSFILYVPIIMKHGLGIGKLEFLLHFLYSQVISVFLLHIAARVLGGRGSIYQTASGYCIWIGFISPIALMLNYPFFFYGGFDDFVDIGSQLFRARDIPIWAAYWSSIVFISMTIVSAIVMLRWIADIHRVSIWRIVASLVVVDLPLGTFHNAVIAPFASIAIEYAATFINEII
jgi:hypothetical protein